MPLRFYRAGNPFLLDTQESSDTVDMSGPLHIWERVDQVTLALDWNDQVPRTVRLRILALAVLSEAHAEIRALLRTKARSSCAWRTRTAKPWARV